MLPFVLYHGSERWTAPREVAGLCVAPGEFLAPCQPAQRYFLLDLGGYTESLPAERNLVAMMIRLMRSRGPGEEQDTFGDLVEPLSRPEHEGLVQAFWTWMGRAHIPQWRQGMELPPLENWREAKSVLHETVNEWTARWLEEGRAEGQVEVMCRMAARKFDAATAERLGGHLARIADPERMGEVGEWLLECEHGEELLERVAGLGGNSEAGGTLPPG